MSWSLFTSNVSRRLNNPNSIESIDDVAELYATEYDKAIKRGFDTIHFIPIATGNVEGMKSLFKLALLQGSNSSSPSFSLITEFGKGVQVYWTGATMKPSIPVLPAPGSIVNISVTSNSVINPGTWAPQPPLPPNNSTSLMVNQFVLAATTHLLTISGIINTISLYPAPPSPTGTPLPGVIAWSGYTIPG